MLVATLTILLASVASEATAAPTDAARLNAYLAGTPMAGLGKVLDRQGRLHGVSPYFTVAVAAKESSHGHRSCSGNPKNVWGLGACGRAWSPPYFETWTQAVNFFVRFVKGRTRFTSGWPNAVTPWGFSGYCDGCEASWATSVSWYMNRMGATTNVRYGVRMRE